MTTIFPISTLGQFLSNQLFRRIFRFNWVKQRIKMFVFFLYYLTRSVTNCSEQACFKTHCIFYASYYQSQLYWQERAAFQRSAFGRSTAGNDVVATISISLFPFFPRFPPPFFRPFFIEGVLEPKKL